MIEALLALLADPALPNPHAALVHLPFALLASAPLFDPGCLVLLRRAWLDRAAFTLYVIGATGAGLAYLSGRQAAASMSDLWASAEATVADHEQMALLTSSSAYL